MRLALVLSVLTLAFGCDDPPSGIDAGPPNPGVDSGPLPPGVDGGPPPPPVDSGGVDANGNCVPTIEICGDRMDQDCDGRDTSCGDTDGDGVMACRAGDDLTMCDCDDSRADVRPPFGGGVAGAPELCDGVDNDCNGRVDEAAECCAACNGMAERADVCTTDGMCDCSTSAGVGPCAAGEACCAGGCVNLQTDINNCGFCGAQCTTTTDRCTAGECRCGDGPGCDFNTVCNNGSC